MSYVVKQNAAVVALPSTMESNALLDHQLSQAAVVLVDSIEASVCSHGGFYQPDLQSIVKAAFVEVRNLPSATVVAGGKKRKVDDADPHRDEAAANPGRGAGAPASSPLPPVEARQAAAEAAIAAAEAETELSSESESAVESSTKSSSESESAVESSTESTSESGSDDSTASNTQARAQDLIAKDAVRMGGTNLMVIRPKLVGTPPAKTMPVRIGSWNLDGCGFCKACRIDRAVASFVVKRDVDILVLQEVGCRSGEEGRLVSLLTRFVDACNREMKSQVYEGKVGAKMGTGYQGVEYGMAIFRADKLKLTRCGPWPPLPPLPVPGIPDARGSARAGALFVFTTIKAEHMLAVISVHLNVSEKARDPAKLVQGGLIGSGLIAQTALCPLVFIGDFNEGHKQLKKQVQECAFKPNTFTLLDAGGPTCCDRVLDHMILFGGSEDQHGHPTSIIRANKRVTVGVADATLVPKWWADPYVSAPTQYVSNHHPIFANVYLAGSTQ